MTPEQWLDLIEARAVRLRAVGVTELTIDGNAVKLAPRDPEIPTTGNSGTDVLDPDPLKNPALYVDGIVPGYTLIPDSGES